MAINHCAPGGCLHSCSNRLRNCGNLSGVIPNGPVKKGCADRTILTISQRNSRFN